VHRHAQGRLPLVTRDRPHSRGLSHDAAYGRMAERREPVHQMAHADAADLLVIRQGDMDGTGEQLLEKCGDRGEHAGHEALHVHRSTADQPLAVPHQTEGVGRPDRLVRRHHVQMAGEDVTGPIDGTDGGEQVKPVSFGTGHDRGGHMELAEIAAHILNDRAVGPVRDGEDCDEVRKNLFHQHVRPTLCCSLHHKARPLARE
jgi:hypothetical protein